MEIKTARLVLRPLGLWALPAVHRYAADPENTRYMFFGKKQTEAETAAFLSAVEAEWEKETPAFYEFALTLAGSPIGAVSVYLDESRSEGELGWILDRRYQRQGYAFEAAEAAVRFARETLGVRRIAAHCDTRNTPSYMLMEKLGMRRISTGPRLYPQTGELAEEYTYIL